MTLPLAPETAFLAAVQAVLLADPGVSLLVADKVFDEVPADALRQAPPWIYAGPMNAQRVGDPFPALTLRLRLYCESTAFGRREAWAIADAAARALDGADLALPAPFVAADIARVTQSGDLQDEKGRCKTAFLDVTTTVQRLG